MQYSSVGLIIDLFLLPLDPKFLTQVLLAASYAKAMLKVLMMLNLNLLKLKIKKER